MLVQTRGEKAVVSLPAPRRSRLVLLLPLVGILVLLAAVALWYRSQEPASENPTATIVAVDSGITATQVPTPTQLTNSEIVEPTADTAVGAYPVATTGNNTAIGNPITLLAPADASEFDAGDITDFRWSWSGNLEPNQQFSVYLITTNGRSLLGSVNTPESEATYSLQTTLPDTSSNAMVEWNIVLEDLVTNRDVVASNNRRLAIKTTISTATATVTHTPTPTFTASPTPIPQVEIFVSSASLRQGPDTVYPILRYLFEGTIVGVIGQEGPEGNWYNVILEDGSRGWVAAVACRWVDESSNNNIPIAATIPVRPTNTPTPTPTNTPTPTFTPTPNPGGGNPQPPSPPPTFTPPPPPPGG